MMLLDSAYTQANPFLTNPQSISILCILWEQLRNMSFSLQLIWKTIAIIISCNGLQLAHDGQELKRNCFGERVIVFVAFSDDHILSQFVHNLYDFAHAFSCSYREQLITIYFGDQSTRIDCDYRQNLIECVNRRILVNATATKNAYEVALFWIK